MQYNLDIIILNHYKYDCNIFDNKEEWLMSQDHQLRSMFQNITRHVSEDVKDCKPLISICEKYHQQPAHVVLITFTAFVFLTMVGLFGHIFVTLFGLLYPAYMSLRAISAQSDEKCRIWLTYWIIFSLLTAFDKLIGLILFFIPGYYLIKLLFYVWMFYPRTHGAEIIYQKLVKGRLLQMKEYREYGDSKYE